VRAVLTALLFVLLTFALQGCPGPTFVVQQFKGPQRPPETIATLRVNASDVVRLVTLDDENIDVPLESDSRLHIELLPGRHALTVRNAKAPDRAEPLAFEAEAGKVYRVTMGEEARIFEVDRGGDKPIRDVTVAK
jgi:hypothetical protein